MAQLGCTGWFTKGVSNNRATGYPKMDGENNGKPYFLMDDLGVIITIFRKHPHEFPTNL